MEQIPIFFISSASSNHCGSIRGQIGLQILAERPLQGKESHRAINFTLVPKEGDEPLVILEDEIKGLPGRVVHVDR